MPAEHASALRIFPVLPRGNDDESDEAKLSYFRAANGTLLLLQQDQRLRIWGGLTFSNMSDPQFAGVFWDNRHLGWISDRSVLVWIDVPNSVAGDIGAFIDELQQKTAGLYEEHGVAQQSIWLTTQPLTIVYPPSK